jgi:uncharacterized protein (DUF4415 family)
MKRASLDEIRRMKDRGEVSRPAAAGKGEDLGPGFWDKAHVEEPRRPRSVHLKLDPEVFKFFYEESKGKGHLTRMQNVLRAYVEARRRA